MGNTCSSALGPLPCSLTPALCLNYSPCVAEAQREFKRTHRNVRKNWQLPPSFPNPVVLQAYLAPHVDKSKKAFTFGRPDPELLRIFCR